ncbi:IS200/IS605 family accessory protein TnpB-related protein [Schinkia azotoformans]|nr:IS200/IS605 family accessory protein TnpB-related protein [Schinkia azotoformans]MEC1694337.1 IS200/IS605 family accessory protein TnpB-related protein [Schinkia azotoformans]MEC1717972.1 IS200/IS605 family accessory protein TnpB-related protein [Schinkia azotoformans]MEC1723380.1 IS200/IS605 family accessory protein TnpB-related protein [Schinkia azotoformans]MEC1746859.1 IS200/IS605 family accessory protein TnpB-related protein [Schinkia azotoformans]MEC1760232.1 IS200/IS605 family access
MKTYFSKRIYKHTLPESTVASLGRTLRVFNQAKHYSFSTMMKEERSKQTRPGEDSLHVYVKKKFSLNDYYANSAVQEAGALIKSQKELTTLYLQNKQAQIIAVQKRMKTIKTKITSLRKLKASFVKGTPQIPGNLRIIKKYNHFFAVHYKKETKIYYHVYHFEHSYVEVELNHLTSRLGRLQGKLNRLTQQVHQLQQNIRSIVFGSKKLYKSQFTQEQYKNNHAAWKQAWVQSRYSKMVVSGRKDAKYGNFVFTYEPTNHLLSFQTPFGDVVAFEQVVFPYGQKQVNHAIETQISCSNKKKYGQPIGWGIEDHGEYYLVKCMIPVEPPTVTNYSKADGVIGIDCNVDHFAVSNISNTGRLLHSFVQKFDMAGKTSTQVTKIIEAEAVAIVDYAVQHKKPLVVEKLNTTTSKVSNPYGNRKANRQMSLFAYRKMLHAIKVRAEKCGVLVYEVNPAYTSQIGKLKYMKRLGISVHQAASYVIGRRAMGFKEKLPPVLHSLVPEKKQGLHHWVQWNAVKRPLRDYPSYWFGHVALSELVRLHLLGELSNHRTLLQVREATANLSNSGNRNPSPR